MRKCAILVMIFLVLASMTGCRGDRTSNSTGSENTSVVASNTDKKANTNEKGMEVIVKSNNKISSKDKEVVLNEISSELDSMIEDINSIEDISDDDINF